MGKLKSGIISQKAIATLTITTVCIVSMIFIAAWYIEVQLTVDAEGSVYPKEPSAVRSCVSGLIREVYVQNNSIIESGQPICSIMRNREFRNLGQAIASLKAARGSIEALANTRSNVSSSQAGTVLGYIDEAVSSVLRIAKTAEDIYSSELLFAHPTDSDTIFSPATGIVVLHKCVAPGEFIPKGEVLGHIEHTGQIEAVLSVDVAKSGRIERGHKVIIISPGGKTYQGRVVQMLGIVSATNSGKKPTYILKAGGFENAITISGNNSLSNQPELPVKAKIVVTEGKRVITLLSEAAFRKTIRGHSGE